MKYSSFPFKNGSSLLVTLNVSLCLKELSKYEPFNTSTLIVRILKDKVKINKLWLGLETKLTILKKTTKTFCFQ